MADLVRFRTRDGRFLSAAPAGSSGVGLHAEAGPPGATETFVFAPGTAEPPLADGSAIVVALVAADGTATPNRWTIVSHREHIPHSPLDQIVFGGPDTFVYVADWAPQPTPAWNPLYMALFTVRAAGGEISIQVTDRQSWYFRVGADGFVVADGAAPFQADTAFTVESGPFDCAAVTGHALDATSLQPLTDVRVVTDGGFAGTSGGNGAFSLVNAANTTCLPSGAHVLTATVDRHRTATQQITVPSVGTLDTQVLLACREITGIVTDGAGIPQSDFSVVLTGPGPTDPPQSSLPDPNTGEFIFRCVLQGDYALSYPGAATERRQVGDDGVSGVHLVVTTSSISGKVSNSATGELLAAASVQVVDNPPAQMPLGAMTQPAPHLGEYVINGVAGGSHGLHAAKTGFVPRELTVVVPATGSVTQDITLDPVVAPASSVVFPTGVDNARLILPGGAADPHWQVVAGQGIAAPRAAAVVAEQHPSGMYYTPTDSAWIWVTADGSGPIDQGFTFRLEFFLVSVGPTTRISGGWGCDNFGSIRLNNLAPAGTGITSVAGVVEGHFNAMKFFTLVGPFLVGPNTLDVVVTDAGNPGGLNVSKLLLTL